jgi:RHS repeat-associated protein
MYYNALGQRVLKAGAAQRIFYVYDEEGHTIGEYGQQYIGTVETVYLGDVPIAVLTPSLIFYAFADHIGTPLVLALPYGQIAWDWRNHDPFGNNAPSNSSFLPAYDLRFTGQIADSETGLFYNYFRDYDPQTGRYVQSDPIGLHGGINTYGYVGSNPISSIDPTGLQKGISFCYGPFCSPLIYPPRTVEPVTNTPWNSVIDDGDGRGRGRESRGRDSSKSEQLNCPDKDICDKDREDDERMCYEKYGNGLRGGMFESMLRGCLDHAVRCWNACYRGERDPGPWTDERSGIPTPGRRKNGNR